MGERTDENPWVDYQYAPWIGCKKVSAGCANCTAADQFPEHWTGDLRNDAGMYIEPHAWKWNRDAAFHNQRRTVFASPYSDIFEPRRDLQLRRREFFNLMHATPNLDWLLLTKHPQHVYSEIREFDGEWPENAGLGVSVENRATYWRVEQLQKLSIPKYKFVSFEPLLEDIPVTGFALHGMNHVILGAEIGPNARSYESFWFERLSKAAAFKDIPIYIKGQRLLDRVMDTHIPEVWGVDLRVRPNLDGVRNPPHQIRAFPVSWPDPMSTPRVTV